jgi:hypothetical protein
VKYAFLEQHRKLFSVAALCKALKVSRAGYYDWRNRGESQQSIRDRTLLEHIRRIHHQSRQHYGIVKCWKQLNNEGISCGRDCIARLRREHKIFLNDADVLSSRRDLNIPIGSRRTGLNETSHQLHLIVYG